jgi:hypothetical protein
MFESCGANTIPTCIVENLVSIKKEIEMMIMKTDLKNKQ